MFGVDEGTSAKLLMDMKFAKWIFNFFFPFQT